METIQPGSLEPIKQEVQEYLYNNQQIAINSQDDYVKAGDIRKQLKNKIKIIEDKRKEYTQPLDESKKRIMEDFKGITKPLEDFIVKLDSEMLRFHRTEQARLDAEQKRIEAEAMAKAKQENVSEVVVPVVNEIKTQRGTVATTTVKKIWKWRVKSLDDVPRAFMLIDNVKVNAMMRDLVPVPGIEYYQEETISSR